MKKTGLQIDWDLFDDPVGAAPCVRADCDPYLAVGDVVLGPTGLEAVIVEIHGEGETRVLIVERTDHWRLFAADCMTRAHRKR